MRTIAFFCDCFAESKGVFWDVDKFIASYDSLQNRVSNNFVFQLYRACLSEITQTNINNIQLYYNNPKRS